MKKLSALLASAAVASSVLVLPAGAATAAPSNPPVAGAGTSKGQVAESLFVRDFFCQLLDC